MEFENSFKEKSEVGENPVPEPLDSDTVGSDRKITR